MTININEMTPQQIADACEQAAVFVEGGWTQGMWFAMDQETKGGVKVCAEGALIAALWGMPGEQEDAEWGSDTTPHKHSSLVRCPLYEAVLDTIKADPENIDDEIGKLYESVAEWNDHEGRTDQEVLDILHKTAKRVLGVEE